MRSSVLGKDTSGDEVQDISPHGVWLLARGREFFLPFTEFPWFKDAPVSAIDRVKLVRKSRLHWPALDVDLDIDSLEHPERYPLASRPDVQRYGLKR